MSLWQRLALPWYMQIAFGLLFLALVLAVVGLLARGSAAAAGGTNDAGDARPGGGKLYDTLLFRTVVHTA